MNRYIVFAFNTYYPRGGIDDVSDSFSELKEAINHYEELDDDNKYIVDMNTWEKVMDND